MLLAVVTELIENNGFALSLNCLACLKGFEEIMIFLVAFAFFEGHPLKMNSAFIINSFN